MSNRNYSYPFPSPSHRSSHTDLTPSSAPPSHYNNRPTFGISPNFLSQRAVRPQLRITTSLPSKYDLTESLPQPVPYIATGTIVPECQTAPIAPIALPSQNPHIRSSLYSRRTMVGKSREKGKQHNRTKSQNREAYVYENNLRYSFLDMEENTNNILSNLSRRPRGSNQRNDRYTVGSTVHQNHKIDNDQKDRDDYLRKLNPIKHTDIASSSDPKIGHKRRLSDKFRNIIGKVRRTQSISEGTSRSNGDGNHKRTLVVYVPSQVPPPFTSTPTIGITPFIITHPSFESDRNKPLPQSCQLPEINSGQEDHSRNSDLDNEDGISSEKSWGDFDQTEYTE